MRFILSVTHVIVSISVNNLSINNKYEEVIDLKKFFVNHAL